MKITCGIYLYSTLINKFLICHATRSKNQWSVPKGLKDDNETSLEAAARELAEETSIYLNKINVLAIHELKPVKYKKQNKVLEPFLVISDTDLHSLKLVCHSLVNNLYPEIDKFEWVGINDLYDRLHEAQILPLTEIKNILKLN